MSQLNEVFELLSQRQVKSLFIAAIFNEVVLKFVGYCKKEECESPAAPMEYVSDKGEIQP